jgi:hypothetical protein
MRVFAALCLLLCSSISLAQQHIPARTTQSNLPILFEPSPGGEGDDTSLIGRATGITVQLRRASITVSLHEAHSDQFEIKFAGAQSSTPQGTNLQKSETNYLVGTDPNRWRIHVPNYGRVTYANLYAGIDAVFYGNGRQLEHDFIISPGADYRQIRMHLSGNTSASVDGDGSLCISLTDGSLKMQKPFIYQADACKKYRGEERFACSLTVTSAFRSRRMIQAFRSSSIPYFHFDLPITLGGECKSHRHGRYRQQLCIRIWNAGYSGHLWRLCRMLNLHH